MNARCIVSPLLTPEELRQCVPDSDWNAATCFTLRRQIEYLTWRALVYRELGAVRIGYDRAGGPVLEGSPLHIGVSHCSGYAAVAISENRCAVDIELRSRDFSRAAARYMTPQEAALDLLHDLSVERIGLPDGEAAGFVAARIRNGEPKRLRLELREDLILVCLL